MRLLIIDTFGNIDRDNSTSTLQSESQSRCPHRRKYPDQQTVLTGNQRTETTIKFMTIQQNNNGNEGAAVLSSQSSNKIQLPRENTCKASPYYGIVSRFAGTDNLVGAVTTEHEGEILTFDFYNPKDGSLYKVFEGNDVAEDYQSSDYDSYMDCLDDVSIIVDVNKCACEVTACNCCGRLRVMPPWHPSDFSFDGDSVWLLCQDELFEFERLTYEGYEEWHGIDPTKYHGQTDHKR